jgi:hypothetical protein
LEERLRGAVEGR